MSWSVDVCITEKSGKEKRVEEKDKDDHHHN